MKAVMLSIQPRHCENICTEISNENGKPVYKKTNEVRKTVPKLETPFKCYIYCTKDKNYQIAPFRFVEGWKVKRFDEDTTYANGCTCNIGDTLNGKIIGEFVCDKVEQFTVGSLRCDDIERMACLSYSEMLDYFYKPNELDGKTVKFGYGWHISELKIYDKPKELGEFKRNCGQYGTDNPLCDDCKYFIDGRSYEYDESDCAVCGHMPLTRPPQSWCYVEEIS